VIALVITVLSDRMRAREFAARRALHAASREKTRLIENLQQTTGELAALNQRLAALNQEMEDVLYVASHDLRAPLINVQGFAHEVRLGLADLRTHTNGAPQVGAIFHAKESLGFIESTQGLRSTFCLTLHTLHAASGGQEETGQPAPGGRC
jgi:signal transduction histidine kinase